MEKIVSLCKRKGFIYQSSEIYGGINGFWDYGPLGAELKRNIKEHWWTTMTRLREDVAGLEATIIMSPKIWEASGHVTTFSDPMCDCLLTKKRFRADQVEPQSGIAYHYDGAIDGEWAEKAIGKFHELQSRLPDLSDEMSREKYANELLEKVGANAASMSAAALGAALQSLLQLKTGNLAVFGTLENAQGVLQTLAWATEFDLTKCPQINDEFSALLRPGKPPEAARKIAEEFYRQRGIKKPVLKGERTEKVENSQRFNPDNGALLTEPRPFNLMFKTYVGPTATETDVAYLRPETAQAIFAQFKNVLESSRQKVPFGIAQMGKAFRNEVTPRNYTFRSREFEQMELEFFIKPDEAIEAIHGSVAKPAGPGHPGEPQPNWGWQMWHQYWVEERIQFYESIGLPRTTLEEYWQKPEELAHYARACVDLLFKFPFGTQELEGIAARSDFDLSQHQRFSGKPMTVFDEELKPAWPKLDPAKQAELKERYYQNRLRYLTKMGEAPEKAEKLAREDAEALTKGYYVPHVIEPSAGVDRLALALITNAYAEDQAPNDKGVMESRVVMRFHPRIAPIKVAVFPLLKNKPELVKKATEVRDLLRPWMNVFFDDAGAIGRRYRRQDEAGTPFGVTIDFDTLGEKGEELKDTVTLRERDTMKQERVKISELLPRLLEKVR